VRSEIRLPGVFRDLTPAIALALAALLFALPLAADEPFLAADPLGVPFRVRDYTFPSFLTLGMPPQPAAPLGKGGVGIQFVSSAVNTFQASRSVEEYLGQTRAGGTRRPIDAADARFIASLPSGEGYYVDADFAFAELGAYFGITDRLDVGISLYYIEFGRTSLDGGIFNFHETFDLGQAGREYVANGQFQIVLGQDGDAVVQLLDGPPDGGFSDPNFFVRYALPNLGRWAFNVGAGIKIPVADPDALSSGNLDYGVIVTADRRWTRNAIIVNAALVDPGRFDQLGVDPPILPSINLAWLYRFERWPATRAFVQGLVAEHVFSEVADSAISDLEIQLTFGLKRITKWGVLGFGLTENLLNYDNTADIGVHFSWGMLSRLTREE
jgi:hypothetical protein